MRTVTIAVSCMVAFSVAGCSVSMGTRDLQAGVALGQAKFQGRLVPSWATGKTRYGKDRQRLNSLLQDMEGKRRLLERERLNTGRE